MPKLTHGRFIGRTRRDVGPIGIHVPDWQAIPTMSLDDLRAFAGRYEAELLRAQPGDHPAWLRKRAERVRTLIRQRERALEHRARQR